MTASGTQIQRLLSIMAQLRNPDGGCPWDLAQDFSSIAPYTIEEAYEVADAIDRGDLDDLKDELGDLLLQVVFHAQMASEQGAFGFDEVVRAISDKLLRRHPHVFAQPGPTMPMPWSRTGMRSSARNAPTRATPMPPRWPASRVACPSGSARPSCRRALPGQDSTGRILRR